MLLPSIELLNKVYSDRNIVSVESISASLLEMHYTALQDKKEKHYFHINFIELAFEKCYDWAIQQDAPVNIMYNYDWWDRVEKKYLVDIPNKNKSFYGDCKSDLIIEACEWIAKQK